VWVTRTNVFRYARLTPSDRDLARVLFSTMAAVFDEAAEALGDEYADRLLSREDFWAIAAFDGDRVVGGVTAHALPMTNSVANELFIYDIAVLPEDQRRGIGRGLVRELQRLAAMAGIHVLFVPADNDDTHALEFYRALGGAASPVTFFTFET
jgi:aminoglycoside 3-N-acetyltransferase I